MVQSPLGPLCEGAPPAGGGGENCSADRNISGYGKVLSLRPFGAPLPLWRKRHLPRIGGVCLAEGGLLTHWGEHCPPLQSSWPVEGGTALDQNVRLDAQAGFAALLGFDEEKPGRGVGAVLDKSQTLRLKARGA